MTLFGLRRPLGRGHRAEPAADSNLFPPGEEGAVSDQRPPRKRRLETKKTIIQPRGFGF